MVAPLAGLCRRWRRSALLESEPFSGSAAAPGHGTHARFKVQNSRFGIRNPEFINRDTGIDLHDFFRGRFRQLNLRCNAAKSLNLSRQGAKAPRRTKAQRETEPPDFALLATSGLGAGLRASSGRRSGDCEGLIARQLSNPNLRSQAIRAFTKSQK
jgi:hypothetical protein